MASLALVLSSLQYWEGASGPWAQLLAVDEPIHQESQPCAKMLEQGAGKV